MTGLPRVIVRLLERRLSPPLFDSIAGDLEEQWHIDSRRSPLLASARLLRVTVAVLWHAWRERRGPDRVAPNGESLMRDVVQDLRFAWRLGVRQPWLSLAAIITLALGIGATTAIFALVNAWLLKPLPFHRPDRIAVVWETIPAASIFENTPAPASVHHWRSRVRAIERFAPWTLDSVNLTGAGDPTQLTVAKASRELLPLLGVDPLVGRNFAPEEAVPNGPPVAVLTHALWMSRFGGRTDAVGRQINLSGKATTVIGVLPADLRLLDLEVDLWQPLVTDAAAETDENRMLWVLGRLREGATIEAASAELDAVMRERGEGSLGARAVPIQEQTVGDMGRDVLVLFGATGFVLLIACANVASLALARMTGRRQELVVRTALGAGRRRIVRQVLTENSALSLVGGTAGLLIAGWGIRMLIPVAPQVSRMPQVDVATPAVFVFAAVVVAAASIVFGLLPAWQSSVVSLAPALRETSPAVTGGSRFTLRSIVVGEIALALALLVGAALVGRSYARLVTVDLGFDPQRAVAFQVPRPGTEQPVKSIAFFDDLLRSLGQQPGIESVGLIQALPLRSSAMGASFRVEGRTGDGSSILSYWRVINADYFRALDIPLIDGRSVEDTDVAGSTRVAVVTESFARRAWPDESALGKRIGWGTLDEPLTVVGVAGDIRLSPSAEPRPHVYMPFRQVADRLPTELVVRSQQSPAAVIDMVRQTIWSLDANQPVAGIATFQELADRSLGRRRFHLTLFALFATVAAVLALVGINGVLSYMVSQMTSEVGLRLALGATPAVVVWRVLKSGLGTVLAGVGLGAIVAVWSAELLRGFLFEVDAKDPLTYTAVALTLIISGTAACLFPALRAARVDPVRALRSQG